MPRPKFLFPKERTVLEVCSLVLDESLPLELFKNESANPKPDRFWTFVSALAARLNEG